MKIVVEASWTLFGYEIRIWEGHLCRKQRRWRLFLEGVEGAHIGLLVLIGNYITCCTA